MNRTLIAGTATVLLGVMGLGVAAEGSASHAAMPNACDVLEAIDTEALVGKPVSFEITTENQSDFGVMSICNASDAEGSPLINLMVRDSTGEDFSSDVKMQRDELQKGLVENMGPDVASLKIDDLGDAGLWTPSIGQLTFWLHEGRTMLIVSGTGFGDDADLPLLRQAAEKIVETFP